MPLLSVSGNGNQAAHLCGTCLSEGAISRGQWQVDGDGHFTSPPCSTCGAQETFLWHDWVYQSTVTKRVPVLTVLPSPVAHIAPLIGPRVVRTSEGTLEVVTVAQAETLMDPEHFGAEQQELIALVAQSLSISRQRRGNGKHKYPTPPKKPSRERVRERFLTDRA